MTGNEYQEKAVSFACYGGNASYPELGLCEEAGEVAGKIAKFIRKHDGMHPKTAITGFSHAMMEDNVQFLKDIAKELGDVMWMVANIATEYGLSLDGIMQQNIDKLTDRKERNVIVGEGDNR